MSEENALELFPPEVRARLRDNRGKPIDQAPPAVKIFCPMGPATWLIHSLDDEHTAFGLCDLGLGTPELGAVGIGELEQDFQIPVRVNGRRVTLPVRLERDLYFRPEHSMETYATAARSAGRITEDREDLESAALALRGGITDSRRERRRLQGRENDGNPGGREMKTVWYTETLVYYDEIQVFTARDEEGGEHLCYAVDDVGDHTPLRRHPDHAGTIG